MPSDKITELDALSKRLGEPEWLSSWRKAQLAAAEGIGKGKKYGIAIPALELAEDPEYGAYPEYSVDASKGLELYTWKEAMTQEEIAPILERLLTSELLLSSESRDHVLARAAFTGGLVVYVQPRLDEKGEYLEESLTLTTKMPLGSASDLIVIVTKEGARLSLSSVIEGGEASSVLMRTTIALLEGESRVDTKERYEGVPGFVGVERTALVSSYAEHVLYEDASDVGSLRSATSTLLLGEHSDARIAHTVLGEGERVADVLARALHQASDTKSEILALGAASDRSRIVYRGLVDMKHGVKGTRGEQEGKFLVLSKDAKVDAVPALDIAASEVVSSHKLSVTHVKDTDLFYAKSRGMDENAAKETALLSFFGELFKRIEGSALTERFAARIAKLIAK